MKNKIILTDIDGCFLSWIEAFTRYMISQGYTPANKVHTQHDDLGTFFGFDNSEIPEIVNTFNSGHWEFGTLPPIDGAIEGSKKLLDSGYRFIGITSCSTHPQTIALRKANLYNVFGDIFDAVHCVDVGESKATHLADHDPSFWIEDKATAANLGLVYGHKCILIDQTWNSNEFLDNRAIRCYGWEEIVNHILKD